MVDLTLNLSHQNIVSLRSRPSFQNGSESLVVLEISGTAEVVTLKDLNHTQVAEDLSNLVIDYFKSLK